MASAHRNDADFLNPPFGWQQQPISFQAFGQMSNMKDSGDFASPPLKPHQQPAAFVTPLRKPRRKDTEDSISTAAPSPAFALTASPCPWGTPSWPGTPFAMPSTAGSAVTSPLVLPMLPTMPEHFSCNVDDMPPFSLPEQADEDDASWLCTGPWNGETGTSSEAFSISFGGEALLQFLDSASPSTSSATCEQLAAPGTPRKVRPIATSPPPLHKQAVETDALMTALQNNSIEEVQEALAEDPEAAMNPFWDFNCEPPLCAAVRLNCSVDVFRLLLQHGADVKLLDARSSSPLGMLAMMAPKPDLPTEFNPEAMFMVAQEQVTYEQHKDYQLALSEVLLAAGADPNQEPSGAMYRGGARPIDLALAAGKQHLVSAWQHLSQ